MQDGLTRGLFSFNGSKQILGKNKFYLAEDLTPAGDKMSFQDFLSNNLSGGLFNGTWISGKRNNLLNFIKY